MRSQDSVPQDSVHNPAAQPTASAEAQRPAAMRFIMLTVLIDMVSIGLIIPVLPALVGSFTGSGLRESHVHDVDIMREAPNYRGGM